MISNELKREDDTLEGEESLSNYVAEYPKSP